MADVSRTDRGQLILITGLLIAVSIVALALVLNTVIYTQNLASRGPDVSARDPIEFRETTADALAGLLADENGEDYASNHSVRGNVTAGIDELDRLLRRDSAVSGVVVNVSTQTLHNGSRLDQTDSTRQFTSAAGAVNWTLATGVDAPRTFTINVSDASALHGTSDPVNETDATFRVTVAGASNEWHLYVYRNTSSSETELAVKNGTETDPSIDVCGGLTSDTPVIDLRNGTVDGSACSAIDFAKGVTPPYDVTYTWGNRIEGTYTVTVNTSMSGAIVSSNFNDPAGGSPFEAHIVYSAVFEVRYETNDLRYRTVIRVVPEGAA